MNRRRQEGVNAVIDRINRSFDDVEGKKPNMREAPIAKEQLDTLLNSLRLKLVVIALVPDFPTEKLEAETKAKNYCAHLLNNPAANGRYWIKEIQRFSVDLDKTLKGLHNKNDVSDPVQTIQFLFKNQLAAEFWVKSVLPKAKGNVRKVPRREFADSYRQEMCQRWISGDVELKKIVAVLRDTCGSDDTYVTIQDFVIFLERFGPFKHSLRKAAALINYKAEKKMPWFSPQGTDDQLDDIMAKQDLQWMIRPSKQKQMRNALVCSVSQELGAANIRIFNSPQGYYVMRNKGRGPDQRFPTIVHLIEHELLISFHNVSVADDQRNISDWENAVGRAKKPGIPYSQFDNLESKSEEGDSKLAEFKPPDREEIEKRLSDFLNPGGLYVVNKNHAQKQGKLIKMELWNEKDVIYWIQGFGSDYKKHASEFEKANINGSRLVALKYEELQRIVKENKVCDLIFSQIEQHKQSVKNGDFEIISKHPQL